MGISSTFNVGGYQIDRQQVNPKLIRDMAESAANIKSEKNALSPKEWGELADRVETQDMVSQEDLGLIMDLGKACLSYRKELKDELAAGGYKDEKLRE